MKTKNIFPSLIITATLFVTIITACRKDAAPAAEAPIYSYNEEFDTLANSFAKGWVALNNSRPIGLSTWNQASIEGLDAKGKAFVSSYPFSAQSAVYSGKDFIMINQNAVENQGTISAWLVSPTTNMKNGDQITFWTRTVPQNFNGAGKDVAERMQVRLSPNANSIQVGSTATSVGDFTTLMLDINPTYVTTGVNAYPKNWNQYTLTIAGLPPTVQGRRFAFRYFVENGGSAAGRAFCVGIDNVSFISK
ncbi:MAG: choice-of-anchor J domain-containing protein [Chitinophagaceae bacterium]|nr:choice-of-anchor J domain-containing protein [Chitinophagaceae bacterium]